MELKVENLCYGYGDRPLLRDITITLRSGDALTILGVNGAGKTTFARCIMQFVRDYKGTLSIDGTLLKKIPVRKRAELIGYVAPNDISELDMTVRDYISLGVASAIDYLSSPSERQYHAVEMLCKDYGLGGFLNRKIRHLSQGERQMVSVLRVLAQDPGIVVFDEPTAALDLKNQKELMALMIRLRQLGKIVIQISHDPNHALRLGGKVLLLFPDKTECADVDELITGELLSELYGTDISISEFKGKKVIIA